MRPPPVIAYSLKAMEATEHAKEQGAFDAFHREVYRAYWEEQRNIGQGDVLRDIALTAGLDWEPLHEALTGGTYRHRVVAQFEQAVSLGIQGIPAFVIGETRFIGAQPLSNFQLAAQRAQAALARDPNVFQRAQGDQKRREK